MCLRGTFHTSHQTFTLLLEGQADFFFLLHCVFSICNPANNTLENAAKMTSENYLFYLKGSALKSVLIHFHLRTYRACITLYGFDKY